MGAAGFSIASIAGAGVSVIAWKVLTLALPLAALVIGGTQAAIITENGIREERTSPFRCATVVGAVIAIVAQGRDTGDTFTQFTVVFSSTCVSIVAQCAIGYIEKSAVSCLDITSCERGARVVIFLARNLLSRAQTIRTDIIQSAGIGVIARGAVWLLGKGTTCLGVTIVQRTRVIIFAINGLSRATAIFCALVAFSASVVVIATRPFQWRVNADTGLVIHDILCARIVVIAFQITRAITGRRIRAGGLFSARLCAGYCTLAAICARAGRSVV